MKRIDKYVESMALKSDKMFSECDAAQRHAKDCGCVVNTEINPDCGGTHCIPGEVDKWKALAEEMLLSLLKAREQKTDFWTTTIGQYIGQELEWAIAKAREAGL